jgi:potassium efflux system protein
MIRFFIKLGILKAFLLIISIGTLEAQSADKTDLILKWDRLASRADEVLERSQASNDTLKIILSDLLKQRKEVFEEQVSSDLKISNLSEELDALGGPPTEGSNENLRISKRRTDLNNLIQAETVPFTVANAMLKRTDFLIEGTNRILRDRLTQKLFGYGATPLDSRLWLPALQDITSFFSRLMRETTDIINSDTQRTLFLQKTPIIGIMLVVATLLFVIFFKGAFYGTFTLLAGSGSRWPIPIMRACLRSLSYLALLSSAFLVIQTLIFSGLFGFNGMALINGLGAVAITLVCSRWLSENLCFDSLELQNSGILIASNAAKASRNLLSVGVVFATTIFLDHLAIAGSWSVETQAVVNFPLLLLASLFLFRLIGQFSQGSSKVSVETKEIAEHINLYLPSQLMNLFRLVFLIAPILGAAGYLYAAQKLIYPTILTLALISLSSVVFALLKNTFDFISEPILQVTEKGVGSRWALLPVLLVIVLAITNIPVIALIWGAQLSDLYEIWMRLNEGIPLGSARVTLPGLISLVVIFCLGFALTRLIQRVLRTTVLPKTTIDSGGQNAVLSGIGYSGIILSTMIAISSTGLDLSSLAIVAGALSVGLGFGLQTIVSNFVSGVILLIERPIKEGDWIEVAGFSGTVRKISVRSTQIQTFDRGTVIVPNSELISGSVLNYTHSNSMGRVRVPVGVAYGTDPRKVESILLGIAESHPQVLKDPGPSVVFMRFGADSIDFEIRAFMKDVGYVLAIKSEMNYEIMEAFNKAGIEIPFAQRDINIKNLDVLKNSLVERFEKNTQEVEK